jgi:uncharacterized membrane protein YhhN
MDTLTRMALLARECHKCRVPITGFSLDVAAMQNVANGPQLPRWRTVGAAALWGKAAARSVRWRGRN